MNEGTPATERLRRGGLTPKVPQVLLLLGGRYAVTRRMSRCGSQRWRRRRSNENGGVIGLGLLEGSWGGMAGFRDVLHCFVDVVKIKLHVGKGMVRLNFTKKIAYYRTRAKG